MPTPVIVQENASYAGTSDLLGFLGVGTSLGTSGPTGEDYDAFISMGGGGDGSSFSEWYSEGGRAGMTLDDWIAIKGVIYVGADVRSLFTNLASSMYFSFVNFSGDTRVVTSTNPLAVQDFSTTACGGFKYTGKGQASIAGEGVVVQSAWGWNDAYNKTANYFKKHGTTLTSFIGLVGAADELSNYEVFRVAFHSNIGKAALKVGWAGEIISIGQNVSKTIGNPTLGNFGRVYVSAAIAATNFIPVVGSYISFMLTGVNNYGGFDFIYKSLDNGTFFRRSETIYWGR